MVGRRGAQVLFAIWLPGAAKAVRQDTILGVRRLD